MKNNDLIKLLSELPLDAEIDLLIENGAQWQFPINGAAYSKAQNTIILMHEKWTGSESDEE